MGPKHWYLIENGQDGQGGQGEQATSTAAAAGTRCTESATPGCAEQESRPVTEAQHTQVIADAITAGLKQQRGGGEEDDGREGAAQRRESKTPPKDTAADVADDARKKVEADAAAKAEEETKARLKGKSTKDFMLSLDERKVLGQTANRRFHELIRFSQMNEEALKTVSEEVTALKQSHNVVMAALTEHGITSGEQLLPLLRYYQSVTSNNLEDALKVVEAQRRMLLTRLGREAEGVDLLADFPDLTKGVEEEQLSRERALELAQHRRIAAEQQQQVARQQQQTNNQQAAVLQRDEALRSISEWEKTVEASPGYTHKRSAVNAVIKEILNDYPPGMWLPTIKRIYAAAAGAPAGNGSRPPEPLRPGGPGGGMPAPSDMQDAIAQGLGYNPKAMRMN